MKRLFLSVLCAVPAFCFGQAVLLYNDGATVKVQAGATLYVEGGIQNTATGTIDNDGVIEVKGNFINAGTWEPSQPNTLKFSGNVNSDVTPGSAQFQTVVIQKDATYNVNLLGNVTVNTNLDFNSTGASKLVCNNFDLKIGSSGTVTGYDADEYVVTGGTGMMQKSVTANGSFTFPVGDDLTDYSPITSTYTGSAYSSATLRVKANDVTHPNKPSDATDFISRYWDVDASGITGYSNSLVGTYLPADVTGTASLIKGASYNGSAWNYAGAAAGSNTVTGTVSATSSDFTGSNFFGKVNLIAFLQGAYNVGTGEMSTTLTGNATILAQMHNSPYADAPMYVATIPANVTDWVKVELRDPANPATVFGKTSAFIKKTGEIIDSTGSYPRIKNGNPTSVVAVVHRTHLSIRTPNAGTDVVNPSLINFSLDTLYAYRNPANNNNSAMKLMSNGKFCMWACNGNSNTTVRYNGPANDRDYLLGTILGGNTGGVISNTYSTGDYNMNGVVRYNGPANDRDFLLGTTLGGNTGAVLTQHF